MSAMYCYLVDKRAKVKVQPEGACSSEEDMLQRHTRHTNDGTAEGKPWHAEQQQACSSYSKREELQHKNTEHTEHEGHKWQAAQTAGMLQVKAMFSQWYMLYGTHSYRQVAIVDQKIEEIFSARSRGRKENQSLFLFSSVSFPSPDEIVEGIMLWHYLFLTGGTVNSDYDQYKVCILTSSVMVVSVNLVHVEFVFTPFQIFYFLLPLLWQLNQCRSYAGVRKRRGSYFTIYRLIIGGNP